MNQEMEAKIELFEKMPVRKSVTKLAVPMILGMMVTLIYNIVDLMFVGKMPPEVRVQATAAVSFVTPVFMMLMGLGGIFGVGAEVIFPECWGKKM
jgi:Na+-driven multidrug efflux pump